MTARSEAISEKVQHDPYSINEKNQKDTKNGDCYGNSNYELPRVGSTASRRSSAEADVEAQVQTPPHDPNDIGPPPDGGLEAWLVVMSTMFLQFCVFGLSQ